MVVPLAALAQIGGQMAGTFQMANGAAGQFSGLLRQAVGPFRSLIDEVIALPRFFKSIADQAAGYVRDFDPGAVLAMQQAMRSFNATIGYALQGVVRGFTASTREFSGAIMTSLDLIKPAVDQVVGLFRTALQPTLQLVNRVLLNLTDRAGRLMPLVQYLGVALDVTITRFVVFYELLSVVINTFADFASELGLATGVLGQLAGVKDLKDVTTGLRNAMVWLTKAFIAGTVTFLRLTGRAEMANRFLTNLAKAPPTSGRPAAPENFQIGTLEDLYRRRLLEAAKATGDDPAARMASAMEDIRGYAQLELQNSWDLKSLGLSFIQMLQSGALAGWIKQGVKAAIAELPNEAGQTLRETPFMRALEYLKAEARNKL